MIFKKNIKDVSNKLFNTKNDSSRYIKTRTRSEVISAVALQSCGAVGSPDSVDIVGRDSGVRSEGEETVICHECCARDLCNQDLCGHKEGTFA